MQKGPPKAGAGAARHGAAADDEEVFVRTMNPVAEEQKKQRVKQRGP